MQPDDIELVRDPKIGDYLNECQLKTCDNPEYKYLWLGTYRFDYSSTKFTGEDIDAFKIKYEESTAGYIQWYHDWSNNSVPSFSIYIEPRLIGSGIGVIALLKFFDYIFIERGIRKISHTVCTANIRAFKVFSKHIPCTLVGVRKQDVKLCDNTYADIAEFELMQYEYIAFKTQGNSPYAKE
jgi:RimJ/RimL family protein N-acetyltransferase